MNLTFKPENLNAKSKVWILWNLSSDTFKPLKLLKL